MKDLVKEFKSFIMQGNLVTAAVAFIIGGAFGDVTKAFTSFVMSIVAKVLGIFNIKDLNFDFWAPWDIKIGPVLTQMINLALVGFVLFLVIKAYNTLVAKTKAEEAAAPPPEPSSTDKLLMEIRDSLKK